MKTKNLICLFTKLFSFLKLIFVLHILCLLMSYNIIAIDFFLLYVRGFQLVLLGFPEMLSIIFKEITFLVKNQNRTKIIFFMVHLLFDVFI